MFLLSILQSLLIFYYFSLEPKSPKAVPISSIDEVLLLPPVASVLPGGEQVRRNDLLHRTYVEFPESTSSKAFAKDIHLLFYKRLQKPAGGSRKSESPVDPSITNHYNTLISTHGEPTVGSFTTLVDRPFSPSDDVRSFVTPSGHIKVFDFFIFIFKYLLIASNLRVYSTAVVS